MINVTGNYFTDLQAAIEAGIIVKKGAKNPPKAEVYAAIEAHNQQFQTVEVETVTPEVQAIAAIDDEPSCEELLALDAEEDARLATQPKKSRKQKSQQPSKLDLLVQAMQDGVTDIDHLAQISGMKPQGVKGWVGVIRNKGLDNWKQSCRKSVA